MELLHQSHRWNSPSTSLMYREQWPLVLVDRCFLYGITLSAEVLQPDSAPAPAIISLGLWHPPVFLVLHCSSNMIISMSLTLSFGLDFQFLGPPIQGILHLSFSDSEKLEGLICGIQQIMSRALDTYHQVDFSCACPDCSAGRVQIPDYSSPCLLWWLLRSSAVHSDASEGCEALGVNSYQGSWCHFQEG